LEGGEAATGSGLMMPTEKREQRDAEVTWRDRDWASFILSKLRRQCRTGIPSHSVHAAPSSSLHHSLTSSISSSGGGSIPRPA